MVDLALFSLALFFLVHVGRMCPTETGNFFESRSHATLAPSETIQSSLVSALLGVTINKANFFAVAQFKFILRSSKK
jgi:hypothetical protein